MIYLAKTLGWVLVVISIPFMLGTLACGETYKALSAAADWCWNETD